MNLFTSHVLHWEGAASGPGAVVGVGLPDLLGRLLCLPTSLVVEIWNRRAL